MKFQSSLYFFIQILLLLFSAIADDDREITGGGSERTSIVFTTLGRSQYAFDIFSLPTNSESLTRDDELRMTDGQSVNHNGFFPSLSSSILSLLPLPNQTLTLNRASSSPPPLQLLVYITERNGSSNIYLDAYYNENSKNINSARNRRSFLEIPTRIQVPLLQQQQNKGRISMKDRPSVSDDYIVYVSTHEHSKEPRKSWAAVYSTHMKTGETRRLTPYGVSDLSPAISPSGIWTAVASSGERGWEGEVEELNTDIYIFKTSDGSERIKVIEHGGWPSWLDDFTLFFHRKSDDGWWSIYRAILPRGRKLSTESVVIERVTPPGLHAFTPATSPGNKSFIALATRRPTSDFRHIEVFDLVTNEFRELTRLVSPKTHHLNPFISPDSTQIGYHKCRGDSNGRKSNPLILENLKSPYPGISLFRIDGSFPSFSPAGDRIAYVKLPGFFVVNSDGSGKREIFSGLAFATAWDWKRKGVIYTSTGPTFASESTEVDIVSFSIDEAEIGYKKLTIGGKNNAFPSPSPDGKWVVFRSGRSGHKNLYIMDALEGEKGYLRRLTEGPWSDTMANWSPDGEWIAFASDRDNPGSGSFAIYLIHPNGTGLKKVIQSGNGGRTNHPGFSPDGRNLVFTSDYAGVSAEPIGNPHHYQPYGDIFVVKLDGSGIRRLTHNSYEDGTPAWGPTFLKPVDVVEWPITDPSCSFDDCHWLAQAPNYGVGVSPKPVCGFKL